MSARGASRGWSARRAPAAVAAALLAGLVPLARVMDPPAPETEAYFGRVRDEVRAIPRTVGRYVGSDAEVARAARELLRPNIILQRTYEELGGDGWFSLVVVHCGDARDMFGHYPPICYPNSGWSMRSEEGVTLDAPGFGRIPATRYELTWPHDRSRGDMSIVNFFALPSGRSPFAREMDELRRLTRARGVSARGAAQIQVLFPASMGQGEREEILAGLLPAVEEALGAVVEGPDDAARAG